MAVEDYIVASNHQFEINLWGEIHSFSEHNELLKVLKQAQHDDLVQISINSPGGDVSVGMMIVQAMKRCKATVVCDVSYNSYSMASIIALAGDYMIMQPDTFLMFHTYYSYSGGKSGDLIQHTEENDKSIKSIFHKIVYPFLTKKEIEKMHRGEDLYIHAEDEDLQKRLARHFKNIDVE